jgi:hypothetical protein
MARVFSISCCFYTDPQGQCSSRLHVGKADLYLSFFTLHGRENGPLSPVNIPKAVQGFSNIVGGVDCTHSTTSDC